MDLVDLYCGVGGMSAGAMECGCNIHTGVDYDDAVLRLWAGNTGGKPCIANLWRDAVSLPPPRRDLHVHLSPPCTELSNARSHTSAHGIQVGLDGIRRALDFILQRQYTSWSLENVSTPAVRKALQKYVDVAPQLVAYTNIDAADFGVPTTRRRLIAGPPALIHRLRETPAHRVSVAEAFRAAGIALPASYIKNNTRSRNGCPCIRSVHGPAHTATASHPLTWCKSDGTTVRCLTVAESAVIQGFPSHWLLPYGSRAGIRAVGNAIPPPLGAAIMKAACGAKLEMSTHQQFSVEGSRCRSSSRRSTPR